MGALVALTFYLPVCASEYGVASWYSTGSRTASGTPFRPDGISCAHKTLKFGTKIRVTDLHTKHSIVCVVNDRGPFVRGRIVDLSRGAAKLLGMHGIAIVKLETML